MAFTVNDLGDFLTALREHPEWRDRVRDEIMSADMRALPGIVRQLGERMDQLGERVDQLGERMDQLSERVDQLGERVELLAERLDSVVDILQVVVARLDRIEGRVGNLEGWQYEVKFKPKNRITDVIRRPVELTLGDLDAVLDRRDDGTLTDPEWEQLKALDYLFRGRLGRGPDAPEVLVTLEVSRVVDGEDVSRARNRADILARCGYQVVAAAGGRRVTAGAQTAAQTMDVRLLIDRSEEEQPAA